MVLNFIKEIKKLTPTDYIINFLSTHFPYPYNILVCISILGFVILVDFYYKQNKDKPEGLVNSNYKGIMSVGILALTLPFLLCGSYFYYDNYIFPDPPNSSFRVAISHFSSNHGDPIEGTPSYIKKEIQATAKDKICVSILKNPPIMSDDEAIHRGKKVGANFCIHGKTEDSLMDVTDTSISIVPISTSQYNQLFRNKMLFKNNESKKQDGKWTLEKNKVIYSPDYYANNSIKLSSSHDSSVQDTIKKNVSSCVYTICALVDYTEFKYDSAIELFKNVTDYENNAEILFYIGNSYSFQNKFNQSLIYYDKVLEINPQDTEAWNNKGIALAQLGKLDKAIEAYDKAIEINPQNSLFWSNKGTGLGQLGKFDEAIKAFDRAIEINPQDSDAWYNKGLALDNLNEYNEAIKANDKAIGINPQ